MNWEQDLYGTYTATAQGLNFTLEPQSWSIWDLSQCQASAAHIANLKQCGSDPWCPGSTVKLFYRPDQAPPGNIKRR